MKKIKGKFARKSNRDALSQHPVYAGRVVGNGALANELTDTVKRSLIVGGLSCAGWILKTFVCRLHMHEPRQNGRHLRYISHLKRLSPFRRANIAWYFFSGSFPIFFWISMLLGNCCVWLYLISGESKFGVSLWCFVEWKSFLFNNYTYLFAHIRFILQITFIQENILRFICDFRSFSLVHKCLTRFLDHLSKELLRSIASVFKTKVN